MDIISGCCFVGVPSVVCYFFRLDDSRKLDNFFVRSNFFRCANDCTKKFKMILVFKNRSQWLSGCNSKPTGWESKKIHDDRICDFAVEVCNDYLDYLYTVLLRSLGFHMEELLAGVLFLPFILFLSFIYVFWIYRHQFHLRTFPRLVVCRSQIILRQFSFFGFAPYSPASIFPAYMNRFIV